MIKQEEMRVVSQQVIAKNIYELTLEGSLVSEMNQPGQFVHLRVQGEIDPLLRRPISIAKIDSQRKRFTMIYRVEGKGTDRLSKKREGETVDVLGPLGNGFPVNAVGRNERALLIGGGIGVPPLYELSHRLIERGVDVVHVLGHESAEKVFYEEPFARLGKTYIATVDGSLGTKGFVTDVIDMHGIEFDCLYACGPTQMLRAIEKSFPNKRGFISLEQRMGCGVGACFACVCHVAGDDSGTSYRKVCTDGPVFPLGEVMV